MSTDTTAEGSRLLLEVLGARPIPRPDPLKRGMERMILELAAMPIPHVPATPDPSDFVRLAEHLETLATIVDKYIREVGIVFDTNTSHKIDISQFCYQLSGALLGNATFECTRAADILREERAEDMA